MNYITQKQKDDAYIESLGLENNLIFTKVMSDKENCRRMLEILLNRKITRMGTPRAEQHFTHGFKTHGIRVDIYVEEFENDGTTTERIYDVEMQTDSPSWLPRRARYYQSVIDNDILEKGASYRSLPETLVIFICTKDPFKKDLPVYTVKNSIEESPGTQYNDGRKTMYFNCSAWKKANTTELKGFLGYILTRTPDGTKYVEKLSKNVKDFKEDAGMRQALLDARAYWDDVAEIAKEEGIEIGKEFGREEGIEIGKEFGREEGIEIGREEGIEIGVRKTAEALLREGLSEELVAKCTRLGLEEVHLISERISSGN